MAKLYNDKIKEQIDDLFAPDVKEEPTPEPSVDVVVAEERKPVKLDSNIGEMVHNLFESVDVVIPEVEILEVAQPVIKKKPTPVAKPLARRELKSPLKESKVNDSTFVDDVASKMSQVQKRTNQASGQERLTEEQLTP